MGEKRTLADELEKHKGKTVLIGARSSFFFIGPAEEALADLPVLSRMARFCVSIAAQKDITHLIGNPQEDIGMRKVVKTYVRRFDNSEDIVIIVAGKEIGAFWRREEYVRCIDILKGFLKNLPDNQGVRT